ncbi:MAG TPA: cytochrome b/b6 domain-containing protein [Burkholderiales bacterium]|nr:cytochrome b/b6 domain-containing protein [Burkholderiales bacterium]
MTHTRVWDAPTRVFHWSLVACFTGEWLTRDARYLDLHVFLGYTMAALVLFRIAWGFVGTRWARFSSFTASPRAGMAYLRALAQGRHPHYIGHNPAGTWSIYLLLLLALSAVVTGVIALGAEKGHGPLAHAFSYATGDTVHELHEWLAWTMLAVVAAHVLGVIAGSHADRENLAGAMVTGYKRARQGFDSVPAHAGIAAALVIGIALAAAMYFQPYASATAAKPYRPFTHAPLPTNATWQAECGSCHIAFHPSLLTARSWDRLLAQQQEHFGEDLGLEQKTIEDLRTYARAHAAERLESPVAWKMAKSGPTGDAPIEITATRYWQHRHASIDAVTWKSVKKSDCGACHLDAEAGTFEPGAIHIGTGSPATKAKAEG